MSSVDSGLKEIFMEGMSGDNDELFHILKVIAKVSKVIRQYIYLQLLSILSVRYIHQRDSLWDS